MTMLDQAALWEPDELQAATGGAFLSHGFAADGIAIDTRKLAQGEMFIALRDARDGHEFVGEALAKGAAGALIDRNVDLHGLPLLCVGDTLAGLQALGATGRARSAAKFIAVTGSVGKSTSKEMLRQIFSAFGKTHAAEASFNNHLGVPLTLARTPRDAAFAVVEIGMNNPGEIAPLAELARPHVAIITNISATHIGHLGSLDAIAREKAELLKTVAPDGTAILPHGPHLALLACSTPDSVRVISFGADPLCEARLLSAESDAGGVDVAAEILLRPVRFRLAAPGRHMAMNAVASLAAAAALGLDVARAAAALDGFAPLAGRGTQRMITLADGQALLLDESYNASGASVRAALAVLGLQPGRHVAVLGDMLELGDFAKTEHRALVQCIVSTVDLVFACGPNMRAMYDDLPAHLRGQWHDTAEALAPHVIKALRVSDAVLVKGSLGSRMRVIVAAIEGAR